MRVMILTAALAAIALSAPAAASPLSDCVVAQVTPEMNRDIASQYLSVGMDGVTKPILPKAREFAARCLPAGQTPADADIQRISTILAGYAMKAGAEAAIAQRHQVSAAQMD